MADFNNIIGGLKIATQIPLDVKTISLTEGELASLGVDDNKAFTYYDGLRVYCLDSRKIYEWREREIGDGDGLLSTDDFTYPNNTICFDIDYSNRIFNFFEVEQISASDIKNIVSPNDSVNITETPTQIQLTVTPPNGSETKISNGFQTTVTGTGTVADPYIVNGRVYQAGSGIGITGLGTSVSPYIISINNVNGNIGWLPGDTKEVVCTNEYLGLNFSGTGLGINERVGWAVMNGATHTYNGNTITVPNDNGRVVVAYGTNYPTLGVSGGSKDAVVVAHSHGLTQIKRHSNNRYGEGFFDQALGGGATALTTDNTGVSGVDKNMQPYVVRLRIIKL
jgi:hypothetical protein